MTTRSALVLLLIMFAACMDLIGSTLNVPSEFSTIQSAIDAAQDGDTVLVEPGVYYENLFLANVSITLASRYVESQDESVIYDTVIDGNGGEVIEIHNVDPTTTIIGFTIRNGSDGIQAHDKFQLLHNRIIGNEDGIDYESGGGLCRWNVFEGNYDDGIDLDGACEVIIEDCIIRNNDDDGIEIRLHPYSKEMLSILIRRNLIQGNGEDGIQFIDYSTHSSRTFLIERNVIADNAMAAIGCMGNENTRENYEAADIPERIFLINNTLSGNTYGVTGGANMVILNNIFAGTAQAALKGIDGDSIAAHNLFWGNGTDTQDTMWLQETCLFVDPALDTEWRLLPGSPCIDAGTSGFLWDGADLLAGVNIEFVGASPDLGAFERSSATN